MKHLEEEKYGKESGFAHRRFSYRLVVKLALAFFLLWALYRLKLLQITPLIFLVRAPGIFIALLFLAWATFPLCALRWWLLLRTQRISPLFLEVFKIIYSSAFFGLYLPGVVGGDVVRVALGLHLSRRQMSVVALSVAVDRLLGVLGLFTLGLFACLVYQDRFFGHPRLYSLFLLLAATFMGGLLLAIFAGLFARRLCEMCRQRQWGERGFLLRHAKKMIESVSLYSDRSDRLALGWVLSVVVHGKNILILAVMARIMKIGGLDIWEYAIIGTITFLLNFLPLTPGGLGVGEAAFTQLALWLEPGSAAPAYATVLLAYRALTALSLLPAPILFPGRALRHSA